MSGSTYRMAPEWAPRQATWLAWPHNESDWPGKYDAAKWAFVEIVRLLAADERVELITPEDDAANEAIRGDLERAHVNMSHVRLHPLDTDRAWLRDSGAIFARCGETNAPVALRFQFNAWAKYDNYKRDQAVPALMAKIAGVAVVDPVIGGGEKPANGDPHRAPAWMTLEGGAVDVNGAGLALVTEECLASEIQERNPGFEKTDTDRALAKWLGAPRVIWLKGGIPGDDTHGHIDDVARFTGERTVVVVEPGEADEEAADPLRENIEILESFRDEQGHLRVVRLPSPEPLWFDGVRLPASYANFYIGAKTVLVPTFNDPADRRALEILQELFPTRVVRGVHCVDLVWGFGTIHCLSQQQPRF